MGRQPCCDKIGLKKGPWTAEEDRKLITFLLTNGQCCWRAVPKLAGLLRCGKSCRLRWTNYLRPDLKRGLLSESEEKLVIDLHSQLGNRWSKIASHMPGRTDNEIKNHWNTHIKKKLRKMGIDPATHKPLHGVQTQQHEQQETRTGHCDDSGLLELPTLEKTTEDERKDRVDDVQDVPLLIPSVSSSSSSSFSSPTSPSVPNGNDNLFGDLGFLFLDNDDEVRMDFWDKEELFTWEALLAQDLVPAPSLAPIAWNHAI